MLFFDLSHHNLKPIFKVLGTLANGPIPPSWVAFRELIRHLCTMTHSIVEMSVWLKSIHRVSNYTDILIRWALRDSHFFFHRPWIVSFKNPNSIIKNRLTTQTTCLKHDIRSQRLICSCRDSCKQLAILSHKRVSRPGIRSKGHLISVISDFTIKEECSTGKDLLWFLPKLFIFAPEKINQGV